MRILANLNVAGTLDIDTVTNAGADTDRFLVQDATGLVRYRTGAEVASDIGAAIGYVSTVKHLVKLGENISKGQAVYVSSSDGTNMIVMKASNASEATSSKTLGLLETGGVTNDQVYAVTEGLLAGLNTSTANAGDTVWLGTDGNLIFGLANKPYAPAHMVFIGIVTRVQQNNGEIFVKVQNGFELQELHNVQITTTPADNTVLSYETSTSLYKMKSISTLLGFTPFANPMTTLGDVIYGGASGVATRLAGNTTTTKQYLSQTGTGSASAAPIWASFNTDARAAISLTTNGTSGVATYDSGTGILNIPNYVGSTGIRLVYSFTATASQTTFTVTSYTPGLIDVFYNGSRLNESEYTATNGTTIVLNIACKVNDIVDIVVYQGNITGLSGVAGAGTANQITYWTGTNTIGALSTSTYPSLTELSYVKGVTSSIQSQLDAKQPLFGNQNANLVYAGPTNGAAASPTFRSLVNADLPDSGVTAGTYNDSATQVKPFTVNAKGLITGVGTAVTITPAWSSITSKPTTISGFGITDAYTKTEVDSFLQGLDPKASVKAATTGTITLSGEQTIDGIAVVAGDRVLVKDQSTQTANGIYVVSASGWSRSTDMDANSEFPGAYVFVERGTANADKGFVCTNDTVSLGSTNITFAQFSGTGAYQAVLNGTGFVRMTGTSVSYITGTSSQFVKADGTLDSSTYVTGGPYLPLAGGTMTGVLNLKADQYYEQATPAWSMDAKNGDIIGLNALYFNDLTDSNWEGINWYNSATTWDSLYSKTGVLYYNPNRTKLEAGTEYKIWHAGNDGSGSTLDADLLDGQHGSYYATASSLSNYLPLTGGTLTGGLTGTSGDFRNTMYVSKTTADTNNKEIILFLQRGTSGTAAAGLGGHIEFDAEDNAGNQRQAALISWDLSDVDSAAPKGRLYLGTRGSTSAITITNDGITTFANNVGINVTPSNTTLAVKGNWVSGHSTVKAYPSTAFASGGLAGYGIFDSDGTTRKAYFAATNDEIQLIGEASVPFKIFSANALALTLSTSQNATFAGTVTATINTLATAASTYVVSDSGTLKTRTAAQVLSDIGAQSALSNPITGDGTETAGNVAYFTGNTTIAGESDFFYDAANNRLRINSNAWGSTGATKLQVGGVLNSGSDAIAQLNGFVRIKDQLIIHQDADITKSAYIQAVDTNVLTIGGTLLIDTTTNVSGYRLQVNGQSWLNNFGIGIRNTYTTSTDYPQLFLTDGAAGGIRPSEYGHVFIQSRSSAARGIGFITGSTPTERMWISGSGPIGIGTTDPNNTMLHIVGDWVSGYSTVRLQGSSANQVGIGWYNTSGTRKGVMAYTGSSLYIETNDSSTPINFNPNNIQRGAFYGNGTIGFGGGTVGVTQEDIFINPASTDPKIYFGRLSSTAGDNAKVYFQNRVGTATMFVDTDTQKVGIGLTTPTALYGIGLEIYDNTGGGTLTLSRDAGNQRGVLRFGRNNGGSFQEAARIIGSSDGGTGANGNIYFQTTNSSSTMTDRMIIFPTGRIAINDSSANGWLQITGNHVGGYGILNINSSDSCIIAMDSSAATPDTYIRLKHNGTDRWYAGMNGAVSTYNYSISYQGNGNPNISLNSAGDVFMPYRVQVGSTGGFSSSSAKLLVGGIISGGSSAIMQVNGFIRMRDQLIIHNDANTASESYLQCTAGSELTTGGSLKASSFFETSDIRLKTNIQDYKSNDILNISAKIYEKDGKIEVGYLAQELEGILDSAISKKENGYLDLSYRQVHTAKIAALEEKIKQLEEQLKQK